MSDFLGRATAAASNAWHRCETCPGEMYAEEARVVASAALAAALDPHDSALQDVILGAMGFYSEGGEFGPMARVQAHDAINALRELCLKAADGTGSA